MTDDTNDPTAPDRDLDVSGIPPRQDALLRRWWTLEIRRAESDVVERRARGAVARPPARARAMPAVLGIAALVAAVALVGVMARPLSGPAANPSGNVVPSATSAPPPSEGSIVFGADGIPTMIAGERVLSVPEVNVRVPRATGPFLVGGWAEGNLAVSCAPALTSVSRRCPRGFALAGDPGAVGRPAASVLLLTGDAPADQGAIVVRVAVNPAAKDCSSIARCPVNPYDLGAVIWRWTPPTPLFANRWPDGIPFVSGTDGVTRPANAARNARLLLDDESFFVAGWLHDPYGGQFVPCAPSPSFLVSTCGALQLTDTPDGPAADLHLAFPSGITAPPDGPVILRVHAHDRRAALCPSTLRIACTRALVVEAVVWTGDDWTATAPLDILTVLFRLGMGQTGVVTPLDPQPAVCIPALPHETYLGAPGMTVGRIAVFPTTVDREQFMADATAGSIRGTQPDGSACRSPISPTSVWVSVDNVAVEVRAADGPTITLIERALHSVETSPVP